jgi:hypothetical protein
MSTPELGMETSVPQRRREVRGKAGPRTLDYNTIGDENAMFQIPLAVVTILAR